MKKQVKARLAALRYNISLAGLVAAGALVPGISNAQSIGDLANTSSTNFTGLTQLLKLGAAFVGVGMVCWAVYGLTLGRKQDSREYPVGQMAAIGLGGAVLTSIALITGVLNTTVFGANNSEIGQTVNLN